MFDYIVKDIMEVAGYLPIGILCGILAVVIYIICVWNVRRRQTIAHAGVKENTRGSNSAHTSGSDMGIQRNTQINTQINTQMNTHIKTYIWKALIWFLLVVYLVVMFVTVFLSREPGSRQGIDMALFGTWGVTPQEHAFVIENILLFLPFGILYPLAASGSVLDSCFHVDGSRLDDFKVNGQSVCRHRFNWGKLTVLWGFLISVGIETVQLITERGYCQLDDVVMNTAGAFAGYVIYAVFMQMVRKRPKNKNF